LEFSDDSANIFLVVEVFGVDAYNSTLLSPGRGGGDLGSDSKPTFRDGKANLPPDIWRFLVRNEK
jgi:hypothetical protein